MQTMAGADTDADTDAEPAIADAGPTAPTNAESISRQFWMMMATAPAEREELALVVLKRSVSFTHRELDAWSQEYDKHVISYDDRSKTDARLSDLPPYDRDGPNEKLFFACIAAFRLLPEKVVTELKKTILLFLTESLLPRKNVQWGGYRGLSFRRSHFEEGWVWTVSLDLLRRKQGQVKYDTLPIKPDTHRDQAIDLFWSLLWNGEQMGEIRWKKQASSLTFIRSDFPGGHITEIHWDIDRYNSQLSLDQHDLEPAWMLVIDILHCALW
jgi:hypothetical protein